MLALAGQAGDATPAGASPGGEITLPPKTPLAALLVNPSGATGRARSSALIDIVDRLVTRHTDFFVRWIDDSQVVHCEGRLACITQAARPDYDRLDYELGNGTMAPFEEHLDHLRRKGLAYAPHLLVLSHVTGEDSDRLSVTLVDTDRALARVHTTDPSTPGAFQALEVSIRAEAVLAEPEWGEIDGEPAAAAFLERLFTEALRPHLEAAGHWAPHGRVELEGVRAGLGVALDGDTIGTTGAGRTTVRGVPAGRHTLRLFGPDITPYEAEVDVERRGVVVLRPQLEGLASPGSQAFRQSLLWGGAGLVVAGAVIAGVALGRADGDVTTFCPTIGEGAGCAGSRFITSGYDPGASPTFDDEVNPSGVLLAPLGYSLALTGATWSLGTLLFGEDGDLPWWQLAAGLVVGGVAYGVSAAAQPSSPF